MGYDPAHDYDDPEPPASTPAPDCGTCPDCGLYVSLVHDRATGETRWEAHHIPRCGDTERWCPNSEFQLLNCAECSEPITKTMVHAVGHDDTRRHMSPTCRDLARERENGHPASGRYRIDPRYGHTGTVTVVELADAGVYEGAVPSMGFHPTQLVVDPTAFDPEPVLRVERERDRILAEAAKIISGDRERDYGSAADGFARTGRIWGAMLGVPDIPAEMVGYMLAGLKLSRLATTPDHRDSIVDGPGYFALAGEIALHRTATDEQDF